MKYINREYGFTGRPPFFKEFYQESNKGPTPNSSNYPEHAFVGMGIDKEVPNGAMLVGRGGSMWGVRISYHKNGKWYDSQDFLKDTGKLYSSSEKGDFSYFTHGNITATCIRYNENSLVMSVASMANTDVRVIFYPKSMGAALTHADYKEIEGDADFYAIFKGKSSVSEEGCVFSKRFEAQIDGRNKREYFKAFCYSEPTEVVEGANGSVIFSFHFNSNVNSRLFIYAAVGDRSIDKYTPTRDEVIAGVSTAEMEFTASKIKGSGSLAQAAEPFYNSVLWHRIYNPYFLGYMYADTRDELTDYYIYDGIQLNVAALLGGHIGDDVSALDQIEYALEDKLMSVLSAWIIFCRNRRIDKLRKLYDMYKQIYRPDGDLVIANGRYKNTVAYRMFGSPLKELERQEDMYSLDMSCMKLLQMDILERMALLCGERGRDYAEAKANLKRSINEKLFNSGIGIYMNRYIGGDWASTVGATSFYPLVAGAVDSAEKLESMIAYLTKPTKLWGETPVATLTRDHPEYGSRLKGDKDSVPPYEDYRGMAVAYINYLVYLGLVRYGVNEFATDLAVKNLRVYNRMLKRDVIADRILPSGKPCSDAAEHGIQGNLFALTAINELFDVEYFGSDLRAAIRFGTFVKGEHSLSNLRVLDRNFNLTVTDNATYLVVDDKEAFTGEGGKLVVRNFTETSDTCEFLIQAEANTMLTLHLPVLIKEASNRYVTFTIDKGRYKIFINGVKVKVMPI